MNSVLTEWNDHMKMKNYLQFAWNYLVENKAFPTDIIILLKCNAHLLRRISKTIKKDMPAFEGIKTFLLECVALIIMCRSMNELNRLMMDLSTIFYTKDEVNVAAPLELLTFAKMKNEMR